MYTKIYIHLGRAEVDRVDPDQNALRVGAVDPCFVDLYIHPSIYIYINYMIAYHIYLSIYLYIYIYIYI